jgi:hypothetical protein
MSGERFGPLGALLRVDFRLDQSTGAPTLMCKVARGCLWPLFHVLAKLHGCPGLDWQRFAMGRAARHRGFRYLHLVAAHVSAFDTIEQLPGLDVCAMVIESR